MKFVYLPSLAVATSLCLMTSGPAPAQPPMTHALIHIKNESNAPATIYFKWGDGKWNRRVVDRGRTHYFNWRYDGPDQRSPKFHVRLDVDTDGVRYVEHVLSRGAAPDDNSPRYGHHYVIKQLQGTDTRYIDNVTPNAVVRVTDKNAQRPRVTS